MSSDGSFLTPEEVRSFYDWVGSKQDSQQWYEGPPLDELIEAIDFSEIDSIFELGFGTGSFAERLLRNYVQEGHYTGLELSVTMQKLASRRLAQYRDRVLLVETDGRVPLPFKSQSFDLFVSNYVFDILSPEQILEMLSEAWRILRPGGRLGLVSLCHGINLPTRIISAMWQWIHSVRPKLVGGCRPVELRSYLLPELWHIDHVRQLSSYGIPSSVLVASKKDRVA